MNCRGCGVVLDPSEEQVNTAVDEVLQASLQDAHDTGGVCPLCGHSKDVPVSHRKTVLFALLLACLLISVGLGVLFLRSRATARATAAKDVITRMSSNSDVIRLLGTPVTIQPGLSGSVTQDETGWSEMHLTIPVRGSDTSATAHVVGGHSHGPWVFTTFEVDFAKEHKKVDLVSGRVIEYDPAAYVDVHTQSAVVPEYTTAVAAEARFNGEFPCVSAAVSDTSVSSQLGNCSMPTSHTIPVDQLEADLRYGNFVLRETDLYLDDVFQVPLTRTYVSNEWVDQNPVHAFGRNCNHPYDIAPIGTRNPYTYQTIVLEDADFLYFDRISKGTGYADSVFQHTETSTRFYKATTRWDGHGWTMNLADGSEIFFPESYNARNLAQGAPYEIRDSKGNVLKLERDPKRNLKQITTPHGHWIRFTYDDSSRITRAEDDAGHWARYEYNQEGMLRSVISSSGRERHFDYSGVLMTQITDEKGRILIHNWYSNRFLYRQQFFGGSVFSYRYNWTQQQTYPRAVYVTLPDSSQKTLIVESSVPEFVKSWEHK
jgi:YD repeat-containing protein